MNRSDPGTRIHIKNFSGVVLGKSPLPPVAFGLALNDLAVDHPEAVIVVGGVNPVIYAPNQARWLVFDIAPAFSSIEPEFLAVSHPVPVVIEVFEQIIGVGFSNDHGIDQREDHSR